VKWDLQDMDAAEASVIEAIEEPPEAHERRRTGPEQRSLK
jgi:hypothetical protein